MGMISIEESELATLRRERDEAKRRNDELAESSRGLTVKVETAEAAQKRAETERDAEKGERTKLEEQAQRTQRAKGRMDNLGAGFLGKLGDTSRAVLSELAAAATDEQWDLALREREELAGVKRDAPPANKPPESGSSESFSNDEVASFLGRVAPANGGGAPPAQDGATSVRQLARAFASKGK